MNICHHNVLYIMEMSPISVLQHVQWCSVNFNVGTKDANFDIFSSIS